MSLLKAEGVFGFKHYRNGKCICDKVVRNAITNEGKDYLLNSVFHYENIIGIWYIGLISTLNYTGVAATDTHALHPGWEEFEDYAGDRVQWRENAPANAIIDGREETFTIDSDTNDLKGFFLASYEGKSFSGSEHILWNTATTEVVVADEDIFRVTYTLQLLNC